MPRPNRTRNVLAEEHLARRVAAERDARGWTNDGLAKRMTDVGCTMTGSAIFKIEKGEPRRRIVVDELVAFAEVFGVPAADLLLPPEFARSEELARLVHAWDQAETELTTAERARNDAWAALFEYAEAQADADGIRRVLVEWVEEKLRHESEPATGDSPEFLAAWELRRQTRDGSWLNEILARDAASRSSRGEASENAEHREAP